MQRAPSRLVGGLGIGTSTPRAVALSTSVQGLRYQFGQRDLSTSPQVLATSDAAGDGSAAVAPEGAPKRKGLLKSILHGSEKAKAEQPVTQADAAQTGQHSHLVGRGKYIHELHFHQVKPGKVTEYKKVVEEYYTKLANADSTSKLTGSWEVVVGGLDSFYHIWEHDGMQALDNIMPRLAAAPEFQDYRDRLLPLLRERRSQLIQEFSFWPSSPPQQRGGIYELRTYDLRPGTLLEWENEWRVGLEARKKFVQPIGAWFAQVGQLHQVLHMWHYNSLDERKQMRQRAWEIDTWSKTVAKTVKLANVMSAQILKPLPFSPLR